MECFAVGSSAGVGAILKSTNGGTTWTNESVPSGVSALFSVVCTSGSQCVAVGSKRGSAAVISTTTGGGTWKTDTVPVSSQLYDVACTSTSNCVAVGAKNALLATTNGGTSWTSRSDSLSATVTLLSVSCEAGAECYLVGDQGETGILLATADGGSTWSNETLPSNLVGLHDIVCLSSTDCLVAGEGAIFVTADSGSTWNSESLPFGDNALTSVNCPSISVCLAVGGPDSDSDINGGGVVLLSSDGGSTWTSEPVPVSVGTLYGIACMSTSDCLAVGYYNSGLSSFILSTTNGGTTWTSQTSSVPELSSIACVPSTSDCFAAGGVTGTVIATTDGGTTWSAKTVPQEGGGFDGISCPSTLNCFVTGGNQGTVLATTDGGASWVSQSLPDDGSVDSISCPTTSDCYVDGYFGFVDATTNGGKTWVSETLPAAVAGGNGDLQGISCPTVSQCEAVGTENLTSAASPVIVSTFDGGASWSEESTPSNVSATAITCWNSAACEAAGAGGVGLKSGGAILSGSIQNPLAISSNELPSAVVGDPYAFYLGASGGTSPYTWSLTSGSLPPGLNLDASTGAITGTPSMVAQQSFTVEAIDSSSTAESASANLSITSVAPLSISTTSLPSGLSTSSYAASLTATGGTAPYNWSILSGSLPPGLVLNTSTGAITGTPTNAPSLYSFMVQVSDASSPSLTASATLSILISAPPTITTTSMPPATVGAAYSATLAATAGTPGYNWSVTSASPPTWLSLDPVTGAITGTPTSSGTFSVTFEVTDANELTDSVTLTLSVFSDPGVYVPLAPVRVCDTRAGNPSHLSGAAAQCSNGTTGETLAANGTVSFSVAGNFGVPSSAITAVVLNVTATGAKAAGYLTVYPAGASRPTASNLNYVPGEAVPNLVEVGLGNSGQVSVFSPSATNVVVDLEGYVMTTPQSGAGLYNALSTPARICDTRGSNPSHLTGGATQCNTNVATGSPDNRVTLATPLSVTVDGNGGVPASGVSAVVLNVTVTRPTAPGYVTAYPAGQLQPIASNVNYAKGETVANRVTVPVSATGQITLYSPVSTDVVVDVSGWYTATGGTTGSEFTPEVAPVRICDTRGSNPSHLVSPSVQCNTNLSSGGPANPLLAGAARTFHATGLADMPSGATAAVLNVTDVAPTAPSYLTVYPQGSPPTTSDVNPPVGGVEANLAVATLTGSGSFDVIDGGSGTTNLVVDVAGWYTSDPTAQYDLNLALTVAKSVAAQNGESYLAPTPMVAALSANEPILTFTTGASTADNMISVTTSADGNGVILAAEHPNSGNCWYAVYNLQAETASTPWSSPGAVFVGAGSWYGEVKNTGTPPVCQAAAAPGGPNSPTQEFLTTWFPAL